MSIWKKNFAPEPRKRPIPVKSVMNAFEIVPPITKLEAVEVVQVNVDTKKKAK